MPVTVNVTLTDESEMVKATEANATIHSVDHDGDPEWVMETNVTKYYMYYRYVFNCQRLWEYNSRTIYLCIVLYLQRPWREKRQITVSSHGLALLLHYQIRSQYRSHRLYGVSHPSVVQSGRTIGETQKWKYVEKWR